MAMSVEKVREYLMPYGVADRMREFEVSSATVELAALAVGVEGARSAGFFPFLLYARSGIKQGTDGSDTFFPAINTEQQIAYTGNTYTQVYQFFHKASL